MSLLRAKEEEGYYTFVIDRAGIKKRFEKLNKEDAVKAEAPRGKSQKLVPRLITKNADDGDYFYKDKRIIVNRKTLYYDVFDILFLYSDQDGFLSYKEIDDYLIKLKHPRLDDGGKLNKRIQNSISNEDQGFFGHAKIRKCVMKNETPDGQQLVEVVRGKGLKLNNPSLK
jgi:hypothetical protein